MKRKSLLRRMINALGLVMTVCSLHAAEYHVATTGLDANDGSVDAPFMTIQRAADVAQPGDVITVHEGTYRERVNPPRGGTSDDQRIVYQAAPGEMVVIKGSEVVKGWEQVGQGVWKVTLPNSFFGDFNPYSDVIGGEWYKTPDDGLDRHTGAVYLNGEWLTEAVRKENVVSSGSNVSSSGELFTIAWMQVIGAETKRSSAASMLKHKGIETAESEEGGEYITSIDDGDWAKYHVDFGQATEQIEFRVALGTNGGMIDVRLDSPTGQRIADVALLGTEGKNSWQTIRTPIEPLSGKREVCLVFKALKGTDPNQSYWFSEVDEKNTTIWAQFNTLNPNQETVEINVRQSVFYPDEPGINYITIRGFTMRHAATPWSGAMSEQIGLIGTHWSKGWLIENNVISHSMNTGITLGCFELEGPKPEATAEGYVEYIKIALEKGWSKENIGSHVVRNNHISHCEKNGIHGSLGGIFSTIEGNTICDIAVRGWISGADVAGLKLLASNDVIIRNNHIYRCGGFGGVWLDWMAQGARFTGNLLHDNSWDLFMEVNHGPFLIDNNVFLSKNAIRDWSQGAAYAHNLIAGSIISKQQERETPHFKPHTVEEMKLSRIKHKDARYYNNLLLGESRLPKGPMARNLQAAGNVNLPGAGIKLEEQEEGFWITVPQVFAAQKCSMVTTELLGKAKVPDASFENPDGNPYRLDTDYFGNKRIPENPAPGPFAAQGDQAGRLKIWPKK